MELTKELIVPIVALICITGLEAFAIFMGIDGVALSLAIGAMSGLGGYQIKKFLSNQEQE